MVGVVLRGRVAVGEGITAVVVVLVMVLVLGLVALFVGSVKRVV